MIVLAVGMPRAGSGWHYNLVHDLMKTTGCASDTSFFIRRPFLGDAVSLNARQDDVEYRTVRYAL